MKKLEKVRLRDVKKTAQYVMIETDEWEDLGAVSECTGLELMEDIHTAFRIEGLDKVSDEELEGYLRKIEDDYPVSEYCSIYQVSL